MKKKIAMSYQLMTAGVSEQYYTSIIHDVNLRLSLYSVQGAIIIKVTAILNITLFFISYTQTAPTAIALLYTSPTISFSSYELLFLFNIKEVYRDKRTMPFHKL